MAVLNTADAVYVGADAVDAVYLGGDLVWSGAEPDPPFSPPATLAHWFKADAITASDNDPVSTWPDSSANGRNATQATAGLKPTYKTNILNGKPVVRFDGGDVLLTPSWTSGEAVTHIVVAKLDANGSYPELVARQDYLFELRFTAATRAPSMGGSSLAADLAAVALGAWHIYSGSWNSGAGTFADAIAIQQDGGTAAGVIDSVVPSTLTGVSSLGARWDATNFFTGDIAEAITLSGSDATALAADEALCVSYLATKYAITVA